MYCDSRQVGRNFVAWEGSPEVEGGESEVVIWGENGGGEGGKDAHGGDLPNDMGNG